MFIVYLNDTAVKANNCLAHACHMAINLLLTMRRHLLFFYFTTTLATAFLPLAVSFTM